MTRGTPPSERVVTAVAERTGRDPVDLPPLYETIDPDALDSLFDEPSVEGFVRFQYAGRTVTVRGDGTVDVDASPSGVIEDEQSQHATD